MPQNSIKSDFREGDEQSQQRKNKDLGSIVKPKKGGVSSRLDNISFYLLATLAFLLPIAFLPTSLSSLSFIKTILFAFLGLTAASLSVYSVYVKQKGSIPLTYIFLLLGLLVAFIISTFFSFSFTSSLFGGNLEFASFYVSGSVIFVSLALPLILNKKKRFFTFFAAILGGAGVLFLFHLSRLLFGVEFLSFGFFEQMTSSPIGTWNSLGVFSGLILIFSLSFLLFGNFPGSIRMILKVFAVVSLFFVGLVNLPILSGVLFCFALLFLIFSILKREGAGNPLLVSLVSFSLLGLLIFSGQAQDISENRFGIYNTEVNVNAEDTIVVASKAIDTPVRALFGTGPNTFRYLWQDFKPAEITRSNLGAVEFTSGSGILPTLFISLGLLGTLVLLVIFAYMLFLGSRYLKRPHSEDTFMRSVTIAAFFGALFLWVLAFLYSFVVVIYIFMFLLLGVFVSGLTLTRGIETTPIFYYLEGGKHIVRNILLGFIFIGVVLIFPAITFGAGEVLYSEGISLYRSAERAEEIEQAKERIALATRFRSSDHYYRTLVDLGFVQIRTLLAREDLTEEELRARLSQLLESIQSDVDKAVKSDPENYLNWMKLGLVYESLYSLGIDKEVSYDNALDAYSRARSKHPNNPEIPLMQARITFMNEEKETSTSFINEALEINPNYAEAYILASGLYLGNNNTGIALSILEDGVENISNSPLLYYELGVVHFNEGNYAEAIDSFTEALNLDSQYANARYLRAISLVYENNNRELALEELGIVLRTNPQNETLRAVISNIENGNDPMRGISEERNIEVEESENTTNTSFDIPEEESEDDLDEELQELGETEGEEAEGDIIDGENVDDEEVE